MSDEQKEEDWLVTDESLMKQIERIEQERDEAKKALLVFAADHNEQLKQARDGRAVAQAICERLTAVLLEVYQTDDLPKHIEALIEPFIDESDRYTKFDESPPGPGEYP